MEATLSDNLMSCSYGKKRVHFDLTGDLEANSAGDLLDDCAAHSSFSPTTSGASLVEDYEMFDIAAQENKTEGAQTLAKDHVRAIEAPPTSVPPALNSPQAGSQGGYNNILSDNALDYRTIASKTPSDPKVPVILIHGDFHSPQIWTEKPDRGKGWAHALAETGHEVYLVDLNLRPSQCYDTKAHQLSRTAVQSTLTATSTRPRTENCAWTICKLHDKWPGSGKNGDPIFEKYYSSLMPAYLDKPSRQAHAQMVLTTVISKIGKKTVLIGEGSGAQSAWLAADIVPELVYGVIAIEPVAAPFGTPSHTTYPHRIVEYSRNITYQSGVRQYGLTDIPLTFDPPLPLDFGGLGSQDGQVQHKKPPLNIRKVEFSGSYGRYSLWLQTKQSLLMETETAKCCDSEGVRQLSQLKKVKHVVVTSHTSSHVLYENATVAFMKQAGLDTTHKLLKKEGFIGNGRLMFLETNSDAIAVKISE